MTEQVMKEEFRPMEDWGDQRVLNAMACAIANARRSIYDGSIGGVEKDAIILLDTFGSELLKKAKEDGLLLSEDQLTKPIG